MGWVLRGAVMLVVAAGPMALRTTAVCEAAAQAEDAEVKDENGTSTSGFFAALRMTKSANNCECPQ